MLIGSSALRPAAAPLQQKHQGEKTESHHGVTQNVRTHDFLHPAIPSGALVSL
jgi:hypothetical protein